MPLAELMLPCWTAHNFEENVTFTQYLHYINQYLAVFIYIIISWPINCRTKHYRANSYWLITNLHIIFEFKSIPKLLSLTLHRFPQIGSVCRHRQRRSNSKSVGVSLIVPTGPITTPPCSPSTPRTHSTSPSTSSCSSGCTRTPRLSPTKLRFNNVSFYVNYSGCRSSY